MINLKLPYIALVPFLLSPPVSRFIAHMLFPAIKHFILSVLGISIGVGLGLGLASFILKELEEAREREQFEKAFAAKGKMDDSLSNAQKRWNNTAPTGVSSTLDDGNSYATLMASAGYNVPQGILRGQIIRKSQEDMKFYCFHPKMESRPSFIYGHLYNIFTNSNDSRSSVSSSKGITTFQRIWPNLPPQVHTEMGILIDLIIRDYITCWYTSVDDGLAYQDEKQKRLLHAKLSRNTHDTSATSVAALKELMIQDDETNIISDPSFMVMSTAHIRSSPFLEILYNSLVTVLGSIATYTAGNINLVDFIFNKLIRIITSNIKTYRELRILALKKCRLEDMEPRTTQQHSTVNQQGFDPGKDKDESNSTHTRSRKWLSVPEIAMTREFLVAGKLHRACTFGLDITSLLFVDPYGKDCISSPDDIQPPSTIQPPLTPPLTEENKVLEQRLFGKNGRILYECELDYNRLLANRLCRILIPRNEFASPTIRTLSVEMLAACVLTPIMGCFVPDFINGMITSFLDKSISIDTAASDSSKHPPRTPSHDEPVTPGSMDDRLNVMDTVKDGESVDTVIDQQYPIDDSTEDGDAFLDEDSHNGDGSVFGSEGQFIDDQFEKDQYLPAQSTDSANDDHYIDDENDNVSLESVESTTDERTVNMSCPSDIADTIQYSLARALIDLQSHIDLEEVRIAKDSNKVYNFDWEACRNAVRKLALVIEAALLHGLRKNIRPVRNLDGSIQPRDSSAAVSDPESMHDAPSAFAQLLMDITGNLDHFGKDEENDSGSLDYDEEDDVLPSLAAPSTTVIATLRTLIAAWLQTGSVFRIMSCIRRSRKTILLPFYHKDAFLRCDVYGSGFTRQLRPLDEIEIPVDTVLIRGNPSADLNIMDALLPDPSSVSDADPLKSVISTDKALLKEKSSVRLGAIGDNIKANFVNNKKRLSQIVRVPGIHHKSSAKQSPIPVLSSGHSTDLPVFLQFHPNDSYTANLRLERERRLQAFANSSTASSSGSKVSIEMICRSRGATERHILQHKELHSLSKYCDGHTLLLSLQNALSDDNSDSENERDQNSTVLIIKGISVRRRFLLPEDDSSFLSTRFSQSRPLEPIGMHSDQRDHNLSFKAFAASYEEPVLHSQSKRYTGGRVVRRCIIRYYPGDRTATVIMSNDNRRLDNRSGILENQKTMIIPSLKSTMLSKEYLSIRHLCYKAYSKGSDKGGPLAVLTAGSSMDIDDFNATPRSGKTIDFVYRASLYEYPVTELTSKRFTVEDSSVMGAHRSDASCLELTDGSLSYALLVSGINPKEHQGSVDSSITSSQDERFNLSNKCPIVLIKLSDSFMSSLDTDRKVSSEVRPYSTSFIRAALLIASSRRESLLQCILSSAKSGSVKNVNRSLADNLLKPTITLLEHATSRKREKQSLVLRDLKLGVHHVDRENLRKFGILNPRYPTILRGLQVVIEIAAQPKGFKGILFQFSCKAISEYVDPLGDEVEYGTFLREEWNVTRTFRDVSLLDKHLKTQIASSDSLAVSGPRSIVGAASGLASGLASGGLATVASGLATVAFGHTTGRKRRGQLLPSLAHSGAPIGGVARKLEKKRILQNYFTSLLKSSNPLCRCPEVLRFLGAHDPLPDVVKVGKPTIASLKDSLGRFDMRKSVVETNKSDIAVNNVNTARSIPLNDVSVDDNADETENKEEKSRAKLTPSELALLAHAKAQLENVQFSNVRKGIFDLIQYMFDLDNASTFRSHMFSALRTVSFAVTSAHEFNRAIEDIFLKFLNGSSVAEHIKNIREQLWPNGVLYDSGPSLTTNEQDKLRDTARLLLFKSFPDQLKAVFGEDISIDGINTLHEMLQNRVILKSLVYQIFDTLVLELFPEIGDVLSGSRVVDSLDKI